MGKNKLRKFSEMEQMGCVLQYPFGVLREQGGFPLRGRWHEEYFHNDRPIVLELGCGKGEYTVGLGRRFPGKNFIGIDIKGARMWSGAREAERDGMSNVAFLRTSIELLASFFAPGEVSEIWITFPDPQMKKTRKRLTSARFLDLYRSVLKPGGSIHLKTDSPFLYTFTFELVKLNNLPVEVATDNLYASFVAESSSETADILSIRTFYEQQWLARGLTIKYLKFALPAEGDLVDPDIEIPHDTYRSFSRRTPLP